jgi:predicted cupin superfamily sugar epimerase
MRLLELATATIGLGFTISNAQGKTPMTADEIIKKFELVPLPSEGGYYKETYRSDIPKINAAEFQIESSSSRNACTAILYLVIPKSFSALHKVKSDEIFHFHGGDAVEMIQIDNAGKLTRFIMGTDLAAGDLPQVVVPRGVWQGLRLNDGGKWALMGTTVAPGFEFEDFALGDRDLLRKQFPQHSDDIIRFSRDPNEKTH